MKAAGTYSVNLSIQIDNLAISLWVRDKCFEIMNAPDFEMIVMKTTRDGEQPIENPILKEYNRRTADISSQMKLLKLTVEDLIGEPDVRTPLDDLDDIMKGNTQ